MARGIQSVLGATIDLSAKTDQFVKDIEAAASQANFDVKGPFVRSFKEAQAAIQGDLAKTIERAASAGLNERVIKKFGANIGRATDDMEKSMKAIFDLEIKIKKGGMNDIQKKEAEHQLNMERDKLRHLDARLKKEHLSADRLIRRRRAAQEESDRLAARSAGEAAEDFGDGIQKAFANLQSGGFADIIKAMGKRAGAQGEAAKEKGLSKGGAEGKIFKGLGSLLAGISPILLAIGGLVAAIAAVASVVTAVDGQAVKLNTTLFESGAAASEVQQAFGGVTDGLRDVRQEFTKFSDNRLWGTTAKDTIEIIGAFAKGGITLKELTDSASKGADAMDKLKNATFATLTYAKILGTTNVEMAEVFSSRMEEMGMTIDGVSESLSSVHMAAKESGFGVKRFFNMVLQATTGMAMYNVRMSEAAGLLTSLGKILGVKSGGEFLQGLTKGFGNESTQDKYKRVMVTGEGRTRSTFQRSAQNTAEDFLKKVGDKQMGLALGDALSKSGLKVDLGDPGSLVKDLGQLTQNQQTKLIAAARLAGDDELVQQLTNLVQVSQGAAGGTGRMAMSLGGLDMGGKLMMSLQQGMSVLGKPLHELTAVQTMAFENMTGVSGEQLEQLRRVSQSLYGNHAALLEIQSKGIPTTDADKADQIRAFGAYVETEGANAGKIVAAKLDEFGRIDQDTSKVLSQDIGSYIQNQGAVFADAAKAGVPMDTQLAQEMVARTTEMTKILEQGVEHWLQKIHFYVEGLYSWFSGSGKEKENRQKALSIIDKEQREARAEVLKQTKVMSDLQASLMTASTPADKANIRSQIEAAKLKSEMASQNFNRLTATRQDITDPTHQGKGLTVAQMLGGGSQKGKASQITKDSLKSFDPALVQEAERKIQDQFVKTALEKAFGTSNRKILEDAVKGKEDANLTLDKFDALGGHARRMAGPMAQQALTGGSPALPEVAQVKKHGWLVDTVLDGVADKAGMDPKMLRGSNTVYRGNRTWQDIDASQFSGALGAASSVFQDKSAMEELIAAQAKLNAEGEKATDQLFGPGGPASKANAKEEDKLARKREQDSKGFEALQTLSAVLADAGLNIPSADRSRMAEDWASGKAPTQLQKYLENQIPGKEGATVGSELRNRGMFVQGATANDFLMQIGSDGQVKFAQRINGSDEVTAFAGKPGGGVDSAMKGGRSGGVTIVQHNYSDMESIKQGWRALMSARAL